MEPAPCGFASADGLDIAAWPHPIQDHALSDGRYIILADIDGPHRIWLSTGQTDMPLAFSIPRDAMGDLRCSISERLDRRLRGAPVSSKKPVHCPTPYQRHRLQLMLAILDLAGPLRDKGVTTYAIAQRLIYPNIRFASSAEWKSSSHRRQIQRLINEAYTLMHGGYREILQGFPNGRQ